jgi:hypothetical protein
MIDGTVTPFPNKGFLKLKFLTRNFISLTKILEDYLRPSEDALKDQAFFAASTTVMFFVIARSLAQIANHDEIGRFTASNIPDGTIVLAVGGELPLKAALAVKDHTLSFSRGIPAQYSACMEFSNLQLARRLFDGKVSALACLGEGLISVNGNIGMIDNLNRLLDRVAAYLG